MSYLLRTNNRKLGVGTTKAAFRSLPRSDTSGIVRPFGGGGQLQVQRPAVTQHQQQLQERVQGVISMDEGTYP